MYVRKIFFLIIAATIKNINFSGIIKMLWDFKI